MGSRGSTKVLGILILVVCVGICNVYAEEEEKQRPTARQVVVEVEKGGVLVPQGILVVEPGFQYSHTSRARIAISGFTILEAIVIGELVARDVKKDLFMPFVNFRYGILDTLQAEMKIPWIYRRDREAWTTDSTRVDRSVDDSAFGDLEMGLYYHLIREKGFRPDIVLNMRVKTPTGKDPYEIDLDAQGRPKELPTGSGHWGLSGGLTLAKTSDPAVFFGSLGYFYNFERDVGGAYGDVKPGDSIEYGIGMAYALSEKLSSSLFWQQRIYFKTEQNGEKVTDTDINVGTIYFGINYALSEKTAVSVSVGAGLTNDAPDVTVEIRIPISIDLKKLFQKKKQEGP